MLHVRNTLTAAASEGARYAATVDRPLGGGRRPDPAADRRRARGPVRRATSPRVRDAVDGAPGVEVDVHADVPPLGLWGPGVRLDVTGHAVEETAP